MINMFNVQIFLFDHSIQNSKTSSLEELMAKKIAIMYWDFLTFTAPGNYSPILLQTLFRDAVKNYGNKKGKARNLLYRVLLDMVQPGLFCFSHFCSGIVCPQLTFDAHNSAFHNLVLA